MVFFLSWLNEKTHHFFTTNFLFSPAYYDFNLEPLEPLEPH